MDSYPSLVVGEQVNIKFLHNVYSLDCKILSASSVVLVVELEDEIITIPFHAVEKISLAKK